MCSPSTAALACFVFKSDAKVRQTFESCKRLGIFFSKIVHVWPKSGNFAAQNNKISMKSRLSTLFLTLLLALTATVANAAGTRLFKVTRSLNRNIVCYDVQLTGSNINTKAPVSVYWINNEDHPGTKKDLNAIERKMAFGYKVVSASATQAKVTLAAYPQRPITISKRNGKWVALITINGKECVLTEIYVKSKGAMSVEYLELRGTQTQGGATQKEKLKP